MKVIKNKKELAATLSSTNLKRDLSWQEEHSQSFNISRTPFWKSIIFLTFLVVGPFLILYFLTSPDLNWSFVHHYHIGARNRIRF